MSNGRCRMHGGATPQGADSPQFKHGRYTKYAPAKIRDKLAAFEDADALDLLPELHMQRALFADYLTRFEADYRLSAGDVAFLMGWSEAIGRMVERIVKMRNETALTAAEVAFIVARIPDVVLRYIDDPIKQQLFVAELFGVVGRLSADANGAGAGAGEAGG